MARTAVGFERRMSRAVFGVTFTARYWIGLARERSGSRRSILANICESIRLRKKSKCIAERGIRSIIGAGILRNGQDHYCRKKAGMNFAGPVIITGELERLSMSATQRRRTATRPAV